MNNFNVVHNRLIEKEFYIVECEKIEKLGFTLYESKDIRVCLKEIFHSELEVETLQQYSHQLRSILIEQSKNVYNTYLILCVNEEIEYERFYMIERNNIALRKYVIRSEDDLNRIPFLETDIMLNENSTNSNVSIEMDYNPKLDMVFELLEKYNAKNLKLKETEIEEIVDSIVQGVESNYEYWKNNN